MIADALRSAGAIMLIIASALAFGHWMTKSGIPGQLVQFTVEHGFSIWQFLLAMNVLLLVTGCFLEVIATLLVVMPILTPALKPLGVDRVHFSIIFTHNMEIGLVHPPVGLNLLCSLRSPPRRSAKWCGEIAVPDSASDGADDHCLGAGDNPLAVDFRRELTRFFHRELTRVNLWFAGHTGVKFLAFSFRPLVAAVLALKRKLSLPVSAMWQWWVRRSSMAVVILASPNIGRCLDA